MIAYFLQATLCLGLFYSFYHLALRGETSFGFNRAYLLTTLLAGLMIPLVPIRSFLPWSRDGLLGEAMDPGQWVGQWPEIIIAARPEEGMDWLDVAGGIYGIVVLMLLVRLAIAVRKLTRLRIEGRKTTLAGYACVLSGRVRTPFSFGRTIYLPDPPGLAGEELLHVLRHEQAHLAGRHSVDLVFLSLVSALFWPIPFLPLYARALRDVHEYAADAAVLRYTTWEPYSRLLVARRQADYQLALSHAFNYSQLKNRITMMNKRPSSRFAMLKYFGLVPLVALSLVSFTRQPSPAADTPALRPDSEVALSAGQTHAHSVMAGDTTRIPPEVDQMPVFPTCDVLPEGEQANCTFKALYTFVADHLKYPEQERVKGIEGRGIASFVIGTDGLMRDIELVEKVSPGIDAEILRIMQELAKGPAPWAPGMKDGKPVAVQMKLPILFKLS